MKLYLINFLISLILISLLGCKSADRFDNQKAFQRVPLNADDFLSFNEISRELNRDLPLLKKQDLEVNGHHNKWITTNSYYLYKIDSLKYNKLLSKVKGKSDNRYWISDSGCVIIELKDMVDHHDFDYSKDYAHQLISLKCNYRPTDIFGMVDTVYVDSVINADWKYVFFKTLAGH